MGFQPQLFGTAREQGGLRARQKGRGRVAGAREWYPVTVGSIVLCLDPAISVCGWAVLKKTGPQSAERIDSGYWRPLASEARNANRFNILADLVKQKCLDNTLCVTDAVIELPNRGPSWKGMSTDDIRANARAIGAIEAACFLNGVIVNMVRVVEWKGRDPKEYTHTVVKAVLKYDSRDHNETDALGIGIWFCAQ